MQQLVRTINTTDAFQMKYSQLEYDLQQKLAPVQEEVETSKEEIKNLERSLVGAGSFTKFLRNLYFFVLIIVSLFAYVFYTENDYAPAIGAVFIAIIILILFLIKLFKYRSIMQKKNQIEIQIGKLKNRMKYLYEKRDELTKYYAQKKAEQQELFETHMLNQTDLITKEVQTLQAFDIQEEKECPRCAEKIKLKAKICRYCRHEFE